MTVPNPCLVVYVAPHLVGVSRVCVRQAGAEQGSKKDDCFHGCLLKLKRQVTEMMPADSAGKPGERDAHSFLPFQAQTTRPSTSMS